MTVKHGTPGIWHAAGGKIEADREGRRVSNSEGLVQAAQQGDRAAIGALCDRYAPLLKKVARAGSGRGSGRKEEIAEWQEEAYLAFLELLRDYRPAGCGSFGAYLLAKLPRRLANKRRGERRRRSHLVPLTAEAAALAGDDHFENDVLNRVWVATLLERISPKQREVLRLIYWEERTPDEVAVLLGISAQEVRHLRRQAERKLRNLVQMY